MTDPILFFLLRTTTIWAALLLFYFLALKANDNWSLKRYFLLAIYILGLVFPLLPTLYEHNDAVNYTISNAIINSALVIRPTTEVVADSSSPLWNLPNILLGFYALTCFILAIRIARSFILLNTWKKTGEKVRFDNYTIVNHPAVKVPVAGFNTIFLPENMPEAEEQMACLHEKIHLENAHSWERLPLLLGSIFLWFHPLQWLFQHLQEQVQEYEVDEGVLQHFSLAQYGKLLIQASMAPRVAWHPNLFSSPLKKRINMMRKVKTKQPWRLRHSIILSLLLGLIVFNCTDVIDTKSIEKSVIYNDTEVDQPAYVIYEDYGADQAMKSFFSAVGRNIKYPLEARSNGIEASIIFNYIIDQNGEIIDLNFEPPYNQTNAENELVVTGYSPAEKSSAPATEAQRKAAIEALEKEITQVSNQLVWNPAMKDNKAVSSQKTFVIRFRLQ